MTDTSKDAVDFLIHTIRPLHAKTRSVKLTAGTASAIADTLEAIRSQRDRAIALAEKAQDRYFSLDAKRDALEAENTRLRDVVDTQPASWSDICRSKNGGMKCDSDDACSACKSEATQ